MSVSIAQVAAGAVPAGGDALSRTPKLALHGGNRLLRPHSGQTAKSQLRMAVA